MPELDLPPGDYRERKPKGWRWKLPWSHEDDVKLPMVMFLVTIGLLGYLLLNLPAEVRSIASGAAALGIGAGCMLMQWLRD